MDPFRLGLVASRTHYFQLVARLGSIRQAAQALNVAPSSISRTIKQLEDDLGTPLFERLNQRLKLTSAGELLEFHLRKSQAEMNRALTEIGDLAGLRRGRVTVAVIESAARGFLPEILARFWGRYPEISVDIRVTGSQEAADLVAEGEADLALVFDVRAPRAARRMALAALPLGVLVPPGHPLCGEARDSVHVYELAEHRVILSDASLTLGTSVQQMLEGSVVQFTRRASTNSIGLMAELAIRGQGIILQTRMGVQDEIERGLLAFLPLADPRLGLRKLALLGRPKTETAEAAQALADIIAAEIDRMRDHDVA